MSIKNKNINVKNVASLPLILAVLLTAGCGTGSIPWHGMEATADGATVSGAEPAAESASGLLDRAIRAHGGDAWAEIDDVSVAYEGYWGSVVPKMQPILSDVAFRSASQETYWPSKGLVLQEHEGDAGEKRVLRTGDGVEVTYRPLASEVRPADASELSASALVADAYSLFLFGPSFIRHRADSLELLPSERVDGRLYDRLVARVRPGFGFSEEDRVVLWIDPGNDRLFRVLFSLEGFETTRGAEVDVTFSEYQEVGGYWWPQRFRERVRAPVRAFAHAWETVDLKVNSGIAPATINATETEAP